MGLGIPLDTGQSGPVAVIAVGPVEKIQDRILYPIVEITDILPCGQLSGIGGGDEHIHIGAHQQCGREEVHVEKRHTDHPFPALFYGRPDLPARMVSL